MKDEGWHHLMGIQYREKKHKGKQIEKGHKNNNPFVFMEEDDRDIMPGTDELVTRILEICKQLAPNDMYANGFADSLQ